MILEEENAHESICKYDRKHWQPLLDLIPEIESTPKFAEVAGLEKDDKGYVQMPYYVLSSVTKKFLEVAYELGIVISFDWGSWDEGMEMVKNRNYNYDSIDIYSKCKIITTLIRADRFCEGTLAGAFSSGLILKLLKSIDRQLG